MTKAADWNYTLILHKHRIFPKSCTTVLTSEEGAGELLSNSSDLSAPSVCSAVLDLETTERMSV